MVEILPQGGVLRGVARRAALLTPDVVLGIDGPEAPAGPLQAVHRRGERELDADFAVAARVRAVPREHPGGGSHIRDMLDGVADPHHPRPVDPDLEGRRDRGSGFL